MFCLHPSSHRVVLLAVELGLEISRSFPSTSATFARVYYEMKLRLSGMFSNPFPRCLSFGPHPPTHFTKSVLHLSSVWSQLVLTCKRRRFNFILSKSRPFLRVWKFFFNVLKRTLSMELYDRVGGYERCAHNAEAFSASHSSRRIQSFWGRINGS